MALALWSISESQSEIAAQIGHIEGAGTAARNITRLTALGVSGRLFNAHLYGLERDELVYILDTCACRGGKAMPLVPFYAVDPELAARETRMLHLLVPQDGLPVGSYGLLEFYCPDPACDCQRVMLNVAEEKQSDRFLASISYGFDRDDEMAGPFLDPLNPQSKYAEGLLQLVEETVLDDPRYVARLERHYVTVKQAACDPKHPAYRKLQKVLADDVASFSLPRPVRGLRRKSQKRKPRRRRRKM